MIKEGATLAGAGLFIILMNILYFGAIIAIVWAIWNWVIMPSLPYIHSVFWGA